MKSEKHKITLRLWIDTLGQAAAALKDNRLRSALSIAGITIGIAAVMAVGTISKSGHYLIFRELDTFGLRSFWIWRSVDERDPNKSIRSGTGIDNVDIDALQSDYPSAVAALSPIVTTTRNPSVTSQRGHTSPKLSGVGIHYLSMNNDSLVSGRNFRNEDIIRKHTVAIIGPTVVQNLFANGADPVGKNIRINGTSYVVIGVLAEKNRDFLASIGSGGGQDANDRVLVPYSTMQLAQGTREVNVIQGEARSIESAELAVRQIESALNHLHARRYSYKWNTMAQYIETANRILQGVSLIGVIAASVSLLVGGMGIMNIVSTSVLERTREIGLRKAVGAKRRHILFQFLMESVIISLIGGSLGLFLGAGASLLLAWLTGFPLAPSWDSVITALSVSVLVGLLSGYLPASRAAKMRPVLALRYE